MEVKGLRGAGTNVTGIGFPSKPQVLGNLLWAVNKTMSVLGLGKPVTEGEASEERVTQEARRMLGDVTVEDQCTAFITGSIQPMSNETLRGKNEAFRQIFNTTEGIFNYRDANYDEIHDSCVLASKSAVTNVNPETLKQLKILMSSAPMLKDFNADTFEGIVGNIRAYVLTPNPLLCGPDDSNTPCTSATHYNTEKVGEVVTALKAQHTILKDLLGQLFILFMKSNTERVESASKGIQETCRIANETATNATRKANDYTDSCTNVGGECFWDGIGLLVLGMVTVACVYGVVAGCRDPQKVKQNAVVLKQAAGEKIAKARERARKNKTGQTGQ